LAWEKPRVAHHQSADATEIVRVDVSSLHAEANPTPMHAKHPCRQAAAQAASSNPCYRRFLQVKENGA
jgi:hypothetical protein